MSMGGNSGSNSALFMVGLAMLLIGLALCIVGLCTYAQAKGQPKLVGLVGILGLIGLLILAVLPDKHKAAMQAMPQPGETPSAMPPPYVPPMSASTPAITEASPRDEG